MNDHLGGKSEHVRRPILVYAMLVGALAGILWGIEPADLSRWHDFEAIHLGMPRDEVLSVVENKNLPNAVCGAFHYENRDSVCRFDDPWREYVINFNPSTGTVNRKRFYFRRIRLFFH
jgi:hypothetical protein